MHRFSPAVLAALVLSFAVGALGLLGVGMALLTPVFTSLSGGMYTGGLTPEQLAAHEEFMANAVRFLPVQLGVAAFRLPLAVGLVAGSALMLLGRDRDGAWLAKAYRYGLVFEPVAVVLMLVLSVLTTSGMDMATYMDEMTGGQPAGLPDGMNDALAGVTWVSVAVGALMQVIWLGLKVGLYWGGLRALRDRGS